MALCRARLSISSSISLDTTYYLIDQTREFGASILGNGNASGLSQLGRAGRKSQEILVMNAFGIAIGGRV
jgi:hypothetical protein